MSPYRILIVDDNATNLRLASFTLEKAGHEVRTAEDAERTMQVLATFVPHLILMDLQLPGVDGLELTRRLKAEPRFRDARIVALTAFAMKGDEERTRAAGCDGYIAKPVQPNELRRVVAEHLEQAKVTGDAVCRSDADPGRRGRSCELRADALPARSRRPRGARGA